MTDKKEEAMGKPESEVEQILLDNIRNLISAGQEALDYSDGSGRPILQEAIWGAQAALDNLPDKVEAMGVQPEKMCMSKLRSLLNAYDGEEISISKFLEEINNHFIKGL